MRTQPHPAQRLFAVEPPPPRAPRGPKGTRVGDIVIADGTRWQVEALDPERHEAICRLLRGSHAQRRFRARQILKVERAAKAARAQEWRARG